MGPLRCHTPDTWLSRGRPDGYVTHPAVAAYRGCVTVQETVNATPGWANSSYVNTTERCTDYPYMPEWDEPYFANSTLELTLLNDSWAEGLGDPNTAEGSYLAQILLTGLFSAQSGATGWMAAVMPTLSEFSVARQSDTTLVVTVAPTADYSIRFPETIVAYAPAETLTSRATALVGTPPLLVSATELSVAASLSGSLLEIANGDERFVRSAAAESYVYVTLVNDTWKLPADPEAAAVALVAGFSSPQTEAGGWNARAGAAFAAACDVYAIDEVTVRIGFPQLAAYDIAAPETISLTIPGAVLTSGRTVRATPDIPIEAEAGSASLDGTLFERPVVDTVQAGVDMAGRALTLRITLQQDAWSAWAAARAPVDAVAVIEPDAFFEGGDTTPLLLPLDVQHVLLAGFAADVAGTDASGAAAGWSAAIHPTLLSAAQVALNCTLYNFSRDEYGYVPWEPGFRYVSKQWLNDTRHIVATDWWVEEVSEAEKAARAAARANVNACVPVPPTNGTNGSNATNGTFCPPNVTNVTNFTNVTNVTVPVDEGPPDMGHCPTPYRAVATDARTVEIHLPPLPAFAVAEPERVRFTVDGSTVVSGRSYEAFPPFLLLPTRGSVEVLESSTLPEATEDDVRANETSLVLRLTGDTWEEGSLDELITQGMTARQSDPNGWNAIVQPRLHVGLASVSANASLLALTIPAISTYDIATRESVVLTIPSSALRSKQRPAEEVSFVIEAVKGMATLSGAVLAGPELVGFGPAAEETSISDLSAERLSFRVTLVNDTWSPYVGAGDSTATNQLVAGLTAESRGTRRQGSLTETFGWEAVVQPGLGHHQVVRLDDETVEVTIPHFPGFDITTPETISLTVPGSAVLSGRAVEATPSFAIAAKAGKAFVSGGLLSNLTQTAINGEDQKLEVVLYGDAWSDDLRLWALAETTNSYLKSTDPDVCGVYCGRYDGWLNITQVFLDGIVALPADPPELFGWNAKLLPTLVPSQLEIIDPQKTTSHRAKITVPRLPEYYIASPETVLVTLPASAVRSGQTVVASPVFEIRPATPVAVIDAPDFEYEDEFGDTVPKDENVISGTGLTDGPTFTISLSGDTWVAAVGNDTYAGYATTTAALLASIFSMQSEPSGWNEIVRPALQPTDLTRVSNTIIRIEAPPDITYDINAPETIRVTVPRETVTGAQPIAADGIIVIKPEPGEAALSGAIFENNTEPDFIMARLPVPTHRHPAVAALGGDGCGLCGAPLEAVSIQNSEPTRRI